MSRHHHPTVFYDSANPAAIPSGMLAAVYVNTDGSYAWPRDEVERMRAVFGISESPNPEFARYARCIAVEQGAASPEDVIAFLQHRHGHGHDDGMVYTDRALWDEVEAICLEHELHPGFWIAAPGLNRDQAAALRSRRGTEPVAVQNEWLTPYDRSAVLRPDRLHFTPASEFTATGTG